MTVLLDALVILCLFTELFFLYSCKGKPNFYGSWPIGLNFSPNIRSETLHKGTYQLSFRPITGMIGQVLKSTLILNINIFKCGRAESDKKTFHKCCPSGRSTACFKPIIPLNNIPFKMDGCNLNSRSFHSALDTQPIVSSSSQ